MPGRKVLDMKRFTTRETKLIAQLKRAPQETIIELREACPSHSACVPLPLFRIQRVGEGFEAEWNTHHRKGPKQTFRFDDALDS